MFFIDKIIFLSSVLSLTNINIMLMKRIIHYFVASAALLFCWTSTEAQVVMKLPETNKAAKSNAGQMQKLNQPKLKQKACQQTIRVRGHYRLLMKKQSTQDL